MHASALVQHVRPNFCAFLVLSVNCLLVFFVIAAQRIICRTHFSYQMIYSDILVVHQFTPYTRMHVGAQMSPASLSRHSIA